MSNKESQTGKNSEQDLSANNRKKRFWLLFDIALFMVAVVVLFFAVKTFVVNFSYLFSADKNIAGFFNGNGAENGTLENTCLDCLPRAIDGVLVEPGQENLYPIAVIIENHWQARPPSGLARANLVFEAEAEGGITRFLAVFAGSAELEEIGPIRSVRPYFIDWAKEFSALLVHVGGSPQALAKISQENIFALNEFYNGGYFWRDPSRPAPHYIYSSSQKLRQYLDKNQAEQGKFLSWQFKPELEQSLRPAEHGITIGFKAPQFVVQWKYDQENNDYLRYLAGELHQDKTGEAIRAKNIIIEFVPAEVIDQELRLRMDYLGSGRAVVCLDGGCREGSWRKSSGPSRSRFYDQAGQEFSFNPGPSWIEIVRPERQVDY